MALTSDDIARLYDSRAPHLLRFFARRTLQPEVAVDLVAETFAQAFADRDRFRGRGDAAAAAWLFAIGRHELTSYFRRGIVEKRAMQRLALEVAPLSADDIVEIEEITGLAPERVELAAGLAALSPAQRQALQLRIIEERSYADVARTLEVTEQTARARVSRALRALAKTAEPVERKAHHA
jgi:RNA polymerase sigma-70 factor (ECF subfamily)